MSRNDFNTNATLIRRARARRRHRAELRALPDGLPVTIRRAYPDDDTALARLAALDDKAVPAGRVVVAEVAGELWAAASLDGAGAVADPFRPSGALLHALRARTRSASRARARARARARIRSAARARARARARVPRRAMTGAGRRPTARAVPGDQGR
jgi:hypothetical protein